ncbi:hypothetical protein [Flaviaesturariibacter terrae]
MTLPVRTLAVSFFLVLSLALSAQRNWRPALVIERGGDSLRGQVDDRQWSVNPQSISFRSGDGVASREYTVSELSAFFIDGSDSYVATDLLLDDSPVELSSLGMISGSPRTQRRVLLRQLYAGRILSLYELQDPAKFHYIVRDSSGVFSELEFRIGYVGDPSNRNIETRRGFRNQLFLYVADKDGALADQVRNAEYTAEDLLRIIPKLNNDKDLSRSQRTQLMRGVKLHVYVGAGIIRNRVDLPSTNYMAKTPEPANSIAPVYTAGIELSEQNRLQHFFFRLGFSYDHFSYSGKVSLPASTIYYEARNLKTIRTTVSFNYQRAAGPVQLYVGPGIAYMRSSVERTNIEQLGNQSALDLQLNAGLRFGPLFVSADYQLPSRNESIRSFLLYAGVRF